MLIALLFQETFIGILILQLRQIANIQPVESVIVIYKDGKGKNQCSGA
jgi:hypothetical protein